MLCFLFPLESEEEEEEVEGPDDASYRNPTITIIINLLFFR
jgi:hypothetical protein